MTDAGLYGPDSVTWRLTRENAMLLGGPRALVMQVAHPLIGAAVAEHSSFRADPLRRLTRTLDATLSVVFGTTEQARRAAAGVARVHGSVSGVLAGDAGRFPAGTPYDASDPALQLWVHATLVDTTLAVYPLVVGPLREGDRERAYEESKVAARAFGVPDDIVPGDLAAFRRYMDGVLGSGDLAAAPFQRELVRDILSPPLRFVPRTAFRIGAALTVALLPPSVRDLYDLELTTRRRRIADWSTRAVRGILPVLPGAVRYTPHARRADRRMRRGRRLDP